MSALDLLIAPDIRRELRRQAGLAGIRPRHLVIPWLLTFVVAGFDAFAYSLLIPLTEALGASSFSVLESSRWFGWIPSLLPASVRGSSAEEAWLGIVLVGLVILGRAAAVLTQTARGIYVMRRQERYATAVREATFTRVLRFGRPWFDRSSLGRVDTELGWSTSALRVLVAFEDLFKNGISLLVKFAVMLQLSVPLTITVAVIFPLIQIALRRFHRRVERVALESAEVERNLRERTLDLLGTLPLVKALGMERRTVDSYAELLRGSERLSVRRGVLSSIRWPAEELLILFAALLAQVVVVLVSGGFSPGDLARLAAFLLLVQQAAPQFKVVGALSMTIAEQAPLIRTVAGLWEDEGKFLLPSGDRPFGRVDRAVEVRGLTFEYGAGAPALRNVATTLPAGATVAVVGESGAGKSTFARLLARLYEAPPESILFDGVPIEAFDAASFHHRVAVVSQEVWILNRTLRENLIFGLEDPPADAELLEALEEVGFTLPEPEGGASGNLLGGHPLLDRVLGDRGAQLSGGQRQRVALIRALLRSPDVLVLDEATAALDSAVEAQVEVAVERRFSGSLLVVVAHRLTTIRQADRILVFREGRLVEEGSWDDLLEQDGEFRRLHRAQFGPVAAGAGRTGPAATGARS